MLEAIPPCVTSTSRYQLMQMHFVFDTVLLFSATHYIKKKHCGLYTNKHKTNGGLYRPVAPLMLRTRGAVHQPVNSLPSGWPSTSPLYGISHLNNPSLCPSPTAPMLGLLCPRPSLVCSFPCHRSCFPTLARAESSDPHPITL